MEKNISKVKIDEVPIQEREIIHLKDTISALRVELEEFQFEKDKAVQEALASKSGEIDQLKVTAQALRDELENLNFQKCY